MAYVQFVLSDVPFERGDFAHLGDADAENRFYDGIVVYAEEPVEAEPEPEPVEEPVEEVVPEA